MSLSIAEVLRAHLLNTSTAQRPKSHSPLKGTEPEKPINTGKASKTQQGSSCYPTGLETWELSWPRSLHQVQREAAVSARGHQRTVPADSWQSRPEGRRQVGLRNPDSRGSPETQNQSLLSAERAPQKKVLSIATSRQLTVSHSSKAKQTPKAQRHQSTQLHLMSSHAQLRGPLPLSLAFGHRSLIFTVVFIKILMSRHG